MSHRVIEFILEFILYEDKIIRYQWRNRQNKKIQLQNIKYKIRR